MDAQRQISFLSVVILALFVVGCGPAGPKLYPVEGIVQYTDGKVLRGGSIEFELIADEPVLATGEIGPDGTFVLGTRALDDGARAGEHRVVVISDYSIGNGAERPGLIPKSELHPKYRLFRTSGLVQKVKPESNALLITVDYAPEEDDEPKE